MKNIKKVDLEPFSLLQEVQKEELFSLIKQNTSIIELSLP